MYKAIRIISGFCFLTSSSYGGKIHTDVENRMKREIIQRTSSTDKVFDMIKDKEY